MAESTITLARIGAAIIAEDRPADHTQFVDGSVISNEEGAQRILLAQFEALATTYKYSKLVKAWIGGGGNPQARQTILTASAAAAADLSAVTWETRPVIDATPIGGNFLSTMVGVRGFTANDPFPRGPWPYAGATTPPFYTATEASYAARALLRASTIAIKCAPTSTLSVTPTEYREGDGTLIPYKWTPFCLNVIIDASVTITSQVEAKPGTPSSGYMSPYSAQTFSWQFSSSDPIYTCMSDWTQTSATFYYRNGDSGSFVSINAGSADHVTLLSSAFSIGTFQWYVTATENTGRTTTSPVYTLTTADSLPTCTPTAPINTIEDGSKSITFEWAFEIATGTAPTGADLQISKNGTTWAALGNVSGSALTWSSSPDSIPSGTKFWRVRAYNADSVAGEWSSIVSFICVAAEQAPIVTTDGKPFVNIRWQSENQQSYRVTIDGTVYGPYAGGAKEFAPPDYLGDGAHTVAVEIQNNFGLWSNPGVASITVENVPGASVTLSGVFYRDAELTWETGSETEDFLVYRDGKRIAHTAGFGFSDRVVLGTHSWQIINRLPNGNYTASNIVTGELSTSVPSLALLAGGEWLELIKSSNEARILQYAAAQTISLRQFAGRSYPDAEVSPYRSEQITLDVAWKYCEAEAARAFEGMLGKPVIYKAPGDAAIVGMLTGWNRQDSDFFRAYTAVVQRIHWGDYVDADD